MNDVQNLIEVQTEYINYNNNNYINQNWDKITIILAYLLEYGRTFYDFSDNSYRTLEGYVLFEKLCLNHCTLFRVSQVFSFQTKVNTFAAVRKIYSDLSFTLFQFTLYHVTNEVFSLIAVHTTERPRGATINEIPAQLYSRMYPITPEMRVKRHEKIPSRGENFHLSSSSLSSIAEREQNFVVTGDRNTSRFPGLSILPFPVISTVFIRAVPCAELRSCRTVFDWLRARFCKSIRLFYDRLGSFSTDTRCEIQKQILQNAIFENAFLLSKTFLDNNLSNKDQNQQIFKTYLHKSLEFLFSELNSSQLSSSNGDTLDPGRGCENSISCKSIQKSSLSGWLWSDISPDVAADRRGCLIKDTRVTPQKLPVSQTRVVDRRHLDTHSSLLWNADNMTNNYLLLDMFIYLASRNLDQLMPDLLPSSDLYPSFEFHYICPAPSSTASGSSTGFSDDQKATRMFTVVRTETLKVQEHKVTHKILRIAMGRVIELDPIGRIYLNSVFTVINYHNVRHTVSQTQTVPPSH